MTLEEMRIDYREAKDKKAQIPIIADQALMTPWEVSVLLHDAGEDVDMRWYAQKRNWNPKKEEPKDNKPDEKTAREEPKEESEHTKLVKVAKAIVKAAPIIAKECGANQEALTAVAILLLAATERGDRA